MSKIYRMESGEIKDQYGNEPTQEEIVDALNLNGHGTVTSNEEEIPVKFTFTVESGSESELRTYTMALRREVAMWEFERCLRQIWKHDDNVNHETINRIWELWHETMSGLSGE